MKKLLPAILITVAVIGAGAFYGGMKYDQSKNAAALQDRQARFQQLGANGGANGGVRGTRGGGFTNGEIISKDDKSITVKMKDGSSKIVFYSSTTEIGKFTSGAITDIEAGKNVSINGIANSDGSITAQSIQIRSPIPANQ